MLYDRKHRRGFLYDKLRNIERKQGVNFEKIVAEENGTAIEINEVDLISYLRTYVVKNGLDELERKLTETVHIRRKLLEKETIEIKTMFPFYFAEPRLVKMINIQL